MKMISVILCVAVIAGCNQAENKEVQKTDTTIQTAKPDTSVSAPALPAPVTSEHFFAVMPCADCEGVETDITVKSDSTYAIHLLYNGRKSKGPGSNEFSESGRWMMHGADTLHLIDRKGGPSMYIKTDSSLVQLDMKGKRITGKMADKYILKKK